MALAPSITINLPGYPFENLPSANSIAALRAVPSSSLEDGANIAVDYGAASGDGLGGLFAWDDASLATDDGANIIKPTDVAPGSAGRWMRTYVPVSPINPDDYLTLTENLGALPAGSTNAIDISRTASAGHAGGTSQFYSLVNRVYAQGANNYDVVRAQYSGTHIDTTAGTTTLADGIHAYVWLSGAGSVTNVQGIASHVRVDGPGDITGEAINFRAVSATLGTGATIGTAKGLSIGQIGDAAKVTNVYGVDVEDQQATTIAIGYRSQISAGTNRYQFFGAGTAASALGGALGVGMTSTPGWRLTVQDNVASYVSDMSNAHASSPYGLRLRYTGVAPNNSTNEFFVCEDTGGARFAIRSNGNVVNTNNSYGAISDLKLKTDIRDAGPQLPDIRAMRLRKYKLISDGEGAHDQLGVIAQELELVSPGLVSETPDIEQFYEPAYERGGVGEPDIIPLIGMGEWKERPSGKVTKNVNYSVLYLKAVGALQEMAGIVDDLQSRLAQIESVR